MALDAKPSFLSLKVDSDGFELDSDANVPIERNSQGEVLPFERFPKTRRTHGHGHEGPIVTALSETLRVEATSQGVFWRIEYRNSERIALEQEQAQEKLPGYKVRFKPDRELFKVKSFSPYIFHSYLKRLSFLHSGVRFVLDVDGKKSEFVANGGIRDMFEWVAAPYQIMHEPIHVRTAVGDLELELVFAFHSWKDDVLWSFVNKGRAVEGGTHEAGLTAGLKQFRKGLDLGERTHPLSNGIVGIMSILYPDAVWEGCIKAKVGDPKLRQLVRQLVKKESSPGSNGVPMLPPRSRN